MRLPTMLPRAHLGRLPALAALLGALALDASAARADEPPMDRLHDAEVFCRSYPSTPMCAAMKMRAAGACAEAIPIFERSQKEAPMAGIGLYLADCLEETGRLKSAWLLFLDVVASAEALGKKALEQNARARAAALEPRIPRLTVTVPSPLFAIAEIAITLDGKPLPQATWNKPLPVDPGDHIITASAPGKARVELTTTLTRSPVDVTIPLLQDLPPPVAPKAAPRPAVAPAAQPPARGMSGRRIAAVALASVGVAGLAVGGVTGALAFARDAAWRSETAAHCQPSGDCTSAEIVMTVQGLEEGRARFATASTIGFVAGGACLAGAAVLWFATPASTTLRLIPKARGALAGMSLEIAF